MKINEPNRITNLQQYSSTRHTRAGQADGARRKDELTISPEAMELLESNRLNGAARPEKLAELKESVSSGTYHVDAGKIAEKLLPYLK